MTDPRITIKAVPELVTDDGTGTPEQQMQIEIAKGMEAIIGPVVGDAVQDCVGQTDLPLVMVLNGAIAALLNVLANQVALCGLAAEVEPGDAILDSLREALKINTATCYARHVAGLRNFKNERAH